MPNKYPKSYKAMLEEKLHLIREAIQLSCIKEENLLDLLASSWAEYEMLEEDYDKLLEIARDYETALRIHGHKKPNDPQGNNVVSNLKLLRILEIRGSKAARLLNEGQQLIKSSIGKRMANAKHGKPGGSREKQSKIREIWASGKYSSRDLCAEKECAALEMSFSTARKALRNTPPP